MNNNFSVSTFEVSNGTYGYNVHLNGNCIFSNDGFPNEEDAAWAAEVEIEEFGTRWDEDAPEDMMLEEEW